MPRPPTDTELHADALSTPALYRRTLDFVRAIARTVDSKAGYFPGHSDGVAYLAQLVGREMGVDADTLRRVQVAALLHDAGKCVVPDGILLAPRALTEAEWVVMRQHPIYSARVAASIAGFDDVAHWVLHHHEHLDGSGYPDGLKGADQIPWQSRLILVCDAFHSMTAWRSYQDAIGRAAALDILEANAGTQFCPTMVSVLAARPAEARFSGGPET